jgi:broad specificity phosphatase PhoE
MGAAMPLFRRRTSPVAALLIALAASMGLASPVLAQDAPTVVVLVRHGEKGTTPAADPPLTDAGNARAQALVKALGGAKLGAVITTQLTRTRETGRPAAEAAKLTMETVPTGAAATHAKAVADAVRAHAGQTVLVVGHSNTVTAIIAALGGPQLPDLCDSEYSSLFTLVLDKSGARLVRGSYGAPSPEQPTGCPNAMR